MTALDDLVLDRPVRPVPRVARERNSTFWPVPSSSLEALVELGMSDESLARYFKVRVEAVTRLRHDFGIN